MCSLSLLSDASGYKCTKVLKGLMKRECFIFSSCQVNIFLILRSTTKKKKGKLKVDWMEQRQSIPPWAFTHNV